LQFGFSQHGLTKAVVLPNQIHRVHCFVFGTRLTNVTRALRHRDVDLAMDRVAELVVGERIHAIKAVSMNEQFFQGHFPGRPIMPGVLQLEAMAQVSSVLMLRKPENAGKIGYFMSADNVKWRRPVFPGDTLFIETEILKMRGSIGQTRCRCLVNSEVVSEAELKFALMDR
jgi:UDP-3-O-[3-hydroxymyristoyl] N-acetylglucosamine deacetylase/3-hydroxyacyl-[acyl-carrier-protein] dehydratase